MAFNYHIYINSEEWKQKRRGFLSNPYFGRPFKCLICHKDTALVVHHLTYERLGEERDEDVCILCDGCHKRVHTTQSGEFQNTYIFLKVFDMKQGFFRDNPSFKSGKKSHKKKRAQKFFKKQSVQKNSPLRKLGALEYYRQKRLQEALSVK